MTVKKDKMIFYRCDICKTKEMEKPDFIAYIFTKSMAADGKRGESFQICAACASKLEVRLKGKEPWEV